MFTNTSFINKGSNDFHLRQDLLNLIQALSKKLSSTNLRLPIQFPGGEGGGGGGGGGGK